MPYTLVTLTQAEADLAARLYDTGAQMFWSDAEKGAYITEALRTWNSLTNFWRDDFSFSLQPNVVWYDITNQTTAPNTLRPHTVTDVDLYTLIQYHFLEPATGATWTGSLQFSAEDLRQAVQRRRDEILSSTGCSIARSTVAAVAGRITLPETVIDIRRMAWLPGSVYPISPMWPDDIWALVSGQRQFIGSPTGVPEQYRVSTEPPLNFETDKQPAVSGNYELLTVDAEADLDLLTPATFGIPDDFTWVAKFGAMGDLLNRDSNARDPLRARYCNLRYQQGLAVLYEAPAILAARIGGSGECEVPVMFPSILDIDSVQNADNFRNGWQAETPTRPDLLLISGLNLIGFAATPDAAYTVTLTVVENAPVTSPLQLSKDDYDSILDYAVHLASFKMGGLEFMATMPLLQRFLKRAALYNSKLSQLGEYQKAIYELSQLQAETNPVYLSKDPTNVEDENA